MSREIRITVDDDEVFERMKARKRELDLSWEEVLHRGLRRESEPRSGPGVAFPGPGQTRSPARDQSDRWEVFADSLEAEIQGKVYDTLRSSLDAAGITVPERTAFDPEVETLSEAEDAELRFPFLPAGESRRVPLRVNLETGPAGLEVEVVAVRSGKQVAEYNTFQGSERAAITEGLATGEMAVLTVGGEESYRVLPVLSWGRDDANRPEVRAVEIQEVRFDDD